MPTPLRLGPGAYDPSNDFESRFTRSPKFTIRKRPLGESKLKQKTPGPSCYPYGNTIHQLSTFAASPKYSMGAKFNTEKVIRDPDPMILHAKRGFLSQTKPLNRVFIMSRHPIIDASGSKLPPNQYIGASRGKDYVNEKVKTFYIEGRPQEIDRTNALVSPAKYKVNDKFLSNYQKGAQATYMFERPATTATIKTNDGTSQFETRPNFEKSISYSAVDPVVTLRKAKLQFPPLESQPPLVQYRPKTSFSRVFNIATPRNHEFRIPRHFMMTSTKEQPSYSKPRAKAET